ncbi:MAG: hypothetical protein JJU28_00600 [Cyclobacteriaceae bacterium]|nr:hypothetical protein [Cyclobacteriaceae bacterium]
MKANPEKFTAVPMRMSASDYCDLEALLITVQHKMAGIDEMVTESFSLFQHRLIRSREWLSNICDNLQKFEDNISHLINTPLFQNFNNLQSQWEDLNEKLSSQSLNADKTLGQQKKQFCNLGKAVIEISDHVKIISRLLDTLSHEHNDEGISSGILSDCIKAGVAIIRAERSIQNLADMAINAGFDTHEQRLLLLNGPNYKALSETVIQLGRYLNQLEVHIQHHVPQIKAYANNTLKQIDGVVTCLQYQDIILQKIHFVNRTISDLINEFEYESVLNLKRSINGSGNEGLLHIMPELCDIFIRQLLLSKIEFQKSITETQKHFTPLFGYRHKADRLNQIMLRRLDHLLEKLFSVLSTLGEINPGTEISENENLNTNEQISGLNIIPNCLSAVEGSLMSLQDYIHQIESEQSELSPQILEQIATAGHLMRQLIADMKSECRKDVQQNNKSISLMVSSRIKEIWHLICNLEHMLTNAGKHLSKNAESIDSLLKMEQESIILIRNQTKIESEVENAISALEIISAFPFDVEPGRKKKALIILKKSYTMESQRQIHESMILDRSGTHELNKADFKHDIEIF